MRSVKLEAAQLLDSKPVSEGQVAWLPGITALMTFLACKGVLIIAVLYPLVNFTRLINPHLQAAVISLLALVTLGLVFRGYRKCATTLGPLAIATVGTIIIVGSMYIAYIPIVESVGLAMLIVAVIWNWRCA